MITITSERLKVEICSPSEVPCVTDRFDRSGVVSQITLDENYTFCAEEPDGDKFPTTGGIGLCSEIQCTEVYDCAAPGTRFSKFGVGNLLKTADEPYSFRKKYDCDPFVIHCESASNFALFVTEPKICNGYALRVEKLICVQDNRLSMKYRFLNAGNKSLRLSEYCHNFLTLNHIIADPGFLVSMPALCSQAGKGPRREKGMLRGHSQGFTFSDQNAGSSMISVEPHEIDRSVPFTWSITSDKTPLSIRARASFAPDHILMWTCGPIISPEVFHVFDLAPKSEIHYEREWIFSHKDQS